jgi:hypothetical protein
MSRYEDVGAHDDPAYWEELALRIHEAALREDAIGAGERERGVSDQTGWLAANFPIASLAALAAAAAAIFVIGWMRPIPVQHDVENAWVAALSPRILGLRGTADGAPSVAALVIADAATTLPASPEAAGSTP